MKFTKAIGLVVTTMLPLTACADNSGTNAGENITITMDLWVPGMIPTNLTWPFNCSAIVDEIVAANNFNPPTSAVDDCTECRITCIAWAWFPPAWAICMAVCELNVCMGH